MTARSHARLLTLIGFALVVAGAEVVREGIATLRQLTVVENDRDTWQRPEAVVQALNLHPGNTVEDLGSGAGYFSLKLARTVGDRGAVLALDLRRVSLAFLWIRALNQGLHAIHVIHGDAGDPAVTGGTALDAALIANTYHELTQPQTVLDSIRQSLRSNGRLVIVDRGPKSASDDFWKSGVEQHEVPSELVERAVRERGFEVLSADNQFIEVPGVGHWWLIVARKP